MVFVSKMKLLAAEEKTSKKGNLYKQALFIQGTDTLNVLCEDSANIFSHPVDREYSVVVDFNPRYKDMRVTCLEPLKNEKNA